MRPRSPQAAARRLVGLFALAVVGTTAAQTVFDRGEWPKTDFTRRTVDLACRRWSAW